MAIVNKKLREADHVCSGCVRDKKSIKNVFAVWYQLKFQKSYKI